MGFCDSPSNQKKHLLHFSACHYVCPSESVQGFKTKNYSTEYVTMRATPIKPLTWQTKTRRKARQNSNRNDLGANLKLSKTACAFQTKILSWPPFDCGMSAALAAGPRGQDCSRSPFSYFCSHIEILFTWGGRPLCEVVIPLQTNSKNVLSTEDLLCYPFQQKRQYDNTYKNNRFSALKLTF